MPSALRFREVGVVLPAAAVLLAVAVAVPGRFLAGVLLEEEGSEPLPEVLMPWDFRRRS